MRSQEPKSREVWGQGSIWGRSRARVDLGSIWGRSGDGLGRFWKFWGIFGEVLAKFWGGSWGDLRMTGGGNMGKQKWLSGWLAQSRHRDRPSCTSSPAAGSTWLPETLYVARRSPSGLINLQHRKSKKWILHKPILGHMCSFLTNPQVHSSRESSWEIMFREETIFNMCFIQSPFLVPFKWPSDQLDN